MSASKYWPKKIIRRLGFPAVREALIVPSGQISLEESRYLVELISGLGSARPIIEIGTLFGWSTRVMVLAKNADAELTTVDSHRWNPLGLSDQKHFEITSSVLAESKRQFNVKQIQQDKAEFYQTDSGPEPALIFLDADHSYDATRSDLEWATKYKNAIICLHDYQNDWPGVMQAVDELGGPHGIVGSLCVLKPGGGYSDSADTNSSG